MTVRGRNVEKKGFGIAGRSYRILGCCICQGGALPGGNEYNIWVRKSTVTEPQTLLKTVSVRGDFLHTNMGTEVNSHRILNLYSKQLASDFLPTNLFTKKVNSHGTQNLYSKQLALDSLPANTYKRVNSHGTTNLYPKQLASDSLPTK